MLFSTPTCPHCFQKGLSIKPHQVRLHVKDPSTIKDTLVYFFCDSPECDVVYFANALMLKSSDLNKDVGIKHSSSEDAYLCYCFHQKKKNINEKTLPRIEKAMQKKGCHCEKSNPRGGCCLSSIRRVISSLSS